MNTERSPSFLRFDPRPLRAPAQLTGACLIRTSRRGRRAFCAAQCQRVFLRVAGRPNNGIDADLTEQTPLDFFGLSANMAGRTVELDALHT